MLVRYLWDDLMDCSSFDVIVPGLLPYALDVVFQSAPDG